MIEVHFTLTEAEYLEAQALYLKDKQRWAKTILRVVFVVGSLIMISSTILRSVNTGDPINWGGVLFPIAVALFVFYLLPSLQRLGFRKRFKVEAPNLANTKLQLDSDGIRSWIVGRGEATIDWSAFSDWKEGKTLFILLSGYTFQPIPKAALNASSINEVRAILASHITRKAE